MPSAFNRAEARNKAESTRLHQLIANLEALETTGENVNWNNIRPRNAVPRLQALKLARNANPANYTKEKIQKKVANIANKILVSRWMYGYVPKRGVNWVQKKGFWVPPHLPEWEVGEFWHPGHGRAWIKGGKQEGMCQALDIGPHAQRPYGRGTAQTRRIYGQSEAISCQALGASPPDAQGTRMEGDSHVNHDKRATQIHVSDDAHESYDVEAQEACPAPFDKHPDGVQTRSSGAPDWPRGQEIPRGEAWSGSGSGSAFTGDLGASSEPRNHGWGSRCARCRQQHASHLRAPSQRKDQPFQDD